jgi:hypothetical protein
LGWLTLEFKDIERKIMSALPTRADIAGTPSNATAKAALAAQYDMVAQRLAAGTAGAGTATEAELKLARESLQVPHRNYIDNPAGPAGIVYQRTVAATADDAYYFDRWYSLSQTGTVTPSTLSSPETGFARGFRVTQSQVSAQRYGFAQILPNDYVRELVSGNASLSFRARISNTTTLRWALLGWSGTADAVTSDVVNDWTSATYTTGNFFITGAGSLSVIATGSQAMTAATFATLSTSAAAIGASINNLILVCWTDSTQAQNTTLDWHDARLTNTDVRVPVVTRSLADEMISCMGDYQLLNTNQYSLMQDVTNAQAYTHGFGFGIPFKRVPATPTLTNNMTGFGAPTVAAIDKTYISVSATASATAAARVFRFSGAVSADL